MAGRRNQFPHVFVFRLNGFYGGKDNFDIPASLILSCDILYIHIYTNSTPIC